MRAPSMLSSLCPLAVSLLPFVPSLDEVFYAGPPQVSTTPTATSFRGEVALYSSAPSGLFSRTAAADLNGDGLLDVGVLCGSALQVAISPSLAWLAIGDVALGVADVAALTDTGDEQASALLYTNGSGLWRLERTSGVWSSTSVAGSGWASATSLQTVQLSGESAPRIYGLMSDGVTIRALVDTGSGYSDQLVMTLSSAAVEVAALDWDGAGAPEIAVMKSSGLEVLGWNTGTSSWDSLYSASLPSFVGLDLAVGETYCGSSGCGKQFLAWLTDFTPNSSLNAMTIVWEGGSVAEWLPSGSDPTTVATGDWDADGSDEVLINSQAVNVVAVFRNLGDSGGPSFDFDGPSQNLEVGPSGAAPTLVAEAAFADLDNDGYEDLLYPVQATGKLYFNRGGWENGFDIDALTRGEVWIDVPATGYSCMELLIEITEWPTRPNGLPFDSVEAAVFIQNEEGANTNGSSIDWDVVDYGGSWWLSLTLSNNPPFDELYYVLMRGVDLDSSNNVLAQGAPLILGFQAQSFVPANGPTSTTNHAYLDSLSSGSSFLVVDVNDCTLPGDSDHGVAVSSAVPMIRIPKLTSEPVVNRL